MTSTSSPTKTGSQVPFVPRRQLLRASLAVGAASGVVATAGRTSAVGAESLPAWSSPATWGTAGVPRPGSVVVVDFPVRLDRDIDVAGLHVECGGRIVFDPQKSVTIRTTGNVEVCGLLEMRPARAEVQHLLRFEGIDERRFVGGGMSVLATDVGLWIHDDGQLDLHGTPRTAWARALGSLAAGERTLRLQAEPVGWRVGDEIVVAPSGSPVDKSHAQRFDETTIAAITGSVVTLSSPLRFAHPAVAVGDGHVLAAEVMNLTRNVRIEGTPAGRAHTMATMVSRPSQIRHVAFRHFGPRKVGAEQFTEFVLGRYGMHWHMAGEGSRGSVLDSVVMRDGGSHAFVTHLSNGVTHRNCVSYNTVETPYWWDGAPDTRTAAPASHDVTYVDCIAARVLSEPAFRGYRLSGFDLGQGSGNSAVGCVAVGVLGNGDASGFQWPEGAHGVWDFRGCVAHNNNCHGIFTWQNSEHRHVVQQFVGYHNGGAGISHGAYVNRYLYRDSILYGNAAGGVLLHAVSTFGVRLQLQNLLIDAAGQSAGAVETLKHVLAPGEATQITNCRFRGYTKAAIVLTGSTSSNRDLLEVSGCTFAARKFWMGDLARRDSTLTWLRPTSSLLLAPQDAGTGVWRERWNARVRRLATSARTGSPTAISIPLKRAVQI